MTLSVFQSTVTDQSGDVQAGAEVEVVNEATGLPATLYSTRGGAATTNPMFADADGFAQFYTEPGEYRITATSGVFSKTWRYVRIGDAGGKDAATVARNGDYMTYGGTANAILLTSANTLPSSTLNVGDRIRFKATTTNTGATTIAVDGGAVKACVTPTGVALPAGFIRTDVITECEYDGSSFVVSRKVEGGSNANGYWTRWEDGTQTAYILKSDTTSISISSFGGFRSSGFGWTFPAAFLSSPMITSDTGSAFSSSATSSSGTSALYNYLSVSNEASASRNIDLQAMGKWY